MATMVGVQKDRIDLLNALLELEYDAIEAYDAAIARIERADIRVAMERFRLDHRRHVAELTPLIQEEGGTPAGGPDIKRVLTKGKVVLASLVGDRAILLAMKTNEDDTNTAYDRIISRGDLPSYVRAVIERGLADERRHRAWIVQQLASQSASVQP